MAIWKSVFKGTIENRSVEVEVYCEGGYRVNTTQGTDHFGDVKNDETSTTIMPPTEKGRKITIDGATIEEILKGLREEGFSEESLNKIADAVANHNDEKGGKQ